jgi:hypothetical protein
MKTNCQQEINMSNLAKLMNLCLASLALTGCSLFGYNESPTIPTIPLPPQRLNASDVGAIPNTKVNASAPGKGVMPASGGQQPSDGNEPRIQEQRSSGGTVSEIKVNNRGNIPDYYIYPGSPNPTSPNPGNSNQNIATPTWQINW